jgi:hypothetical protein
MCTAKQYRAKAAEYKERADMAIIPNEKRQLQDMGAKLQHPCGQ